MKTYTPSDYERIYEVKNLEYINDEGRTINVSELTSYIIQKVREGIIPNDLVKIIASINSIREEKRRTDLLAAIVDFIYGLDKGFNIKAKEFTDLLHTDEYDRLILDNPQQFNKKFNKETYVSFVKYYFTEPYTPRNRFFIKYWNREYEIVGRYTLLHVFRKLLFKHTLPLRFPLHPESNELLKSEDFYRFVMASEFLWRRAGVFQRKNILRAKSPYLDVASKHGLPENLVREIIEEFFDEILYGDYSKGDMVNVGKYKVRIDNKTVTSVAIRLLSR